MKKLFYSLTFIALISILTSCTPKPEEQILGAWNLDKAELENIDEFAQNMINIQVGVLDEQIAQIETQIEALGEEAEELEVETLQAQLDELLTQKSELTLDKFKEDFNAKFEELKEEFVLEVNVDKTYKKLPEDENGTWSLNEDASELTLTGEDGEARTFSVNELSAEKLVLKIEDGEAEMKMVMLMTFSKGESGATETTDEETDETEEETTE